MTLIRFTDIHGKNVILNADHLVVVASSVNPNQTYVETSNGVMYFIQGDFETVSNSILRQIPGD